MLWQQLLQANSCDQTQAASAPWVRARAEHGLLAERDLAGNRRQGDQTAGCGNRWRTHGVGFAGFFSRCPGCHNSVVCWEPAGKLSARSIQLGTAVAPSLPQRLQRIRGPKDGTGASSSQSSILIARSCPQVLASQEQATDAVAPLAAERQDGLVRHPWPCPKLRTHRGRNQVTVIGSGKTNVALSG